MTLPNLNHPLSFIGIFFSVCLILAVQNVVPAQPDARKIARIEADGLQTISTETVIGISGLKIGDTFSVAATDAAAERLVNSGLFKNVGYRTRTSGAAITIAFQLEERKGNQSPVVFDNFIWFSDEELTAGVQREVPAFNGSAPDTGKTTDAIRQALQNLLLERKLPGRVEYVLTETQHLFRVADVSLKICTLHFPGALHVSEQKLIQATRSSTDPEYSRQSAKAFPKYGLFPIYRELGHLRASFGTPHAKPDTNPGCEGGVDLTIPVNEGAAYSWAKPEWSGNQVLTTNELDAALGMKPGEVANGKKFDKGIRDVKKAYGKHGHIEARFGSEPEFDDAAQRVTYRIAVNEGRQYRMGTVDFKGFSDADATALKEKWRLQSGEIFDASYSDRFFGEDATVIMSRIVVARRAQRKPLPTVSSLPDRQALIVNVTIEMK